MIWTVRLLGTVLHFVSFPTHTQMHQLHAQRLVKCDPEIFDCQWNLLHQCNVNLLRPKDTPFARVSKCRQKKITWKFFAALHRDDQKSKWASKIRRMTDGKNWFEKIELHGDEHLQHHSKSTNSDAVHYGEEHCFLTCPHFPFAARVRHSWLGASKFRNRSWWNSKVDLLRGVNQPKPTQSLACSAAWLVGLLKLADFECLRSRVGALDGACLRFGTTCSGINVCSNILRH